MRRAVVDIGGTACRLVVAEAAGGGWPRTCEDREVVLGLTRAVRRDGRLGDGLLELTTETLRRLRASAFTAAADDLRATLAGSLLAAADGPELHRRAEAALGTPVEVVEAVDDAVAAGRAARHRLGLAATPALIEVADHHLRVAEPGATGAPSVREVPAGLRDVLPRGAVDPLHPAALTRVRAALEDRLAALEPVAAAPGDPRWPVLVGAPARALARAVGGRRYGEEVTAVDGARLSAAALADLERELLATRGADRLLLRGLDPAAVDEVAVTVLLLRATLDRLGAPGVVVATVGSVEGRLLDDLGVSADPIAARRDAVAAVTTPHAAHVAHLVGQLVDRLAGPLELTAGDRDRVVTAARLHDLGRTGPAAHRRGAHQLVTDGVPGVGPEELVELACLVRFQTGRLPGAHFTPFDRLGAARRRTIERLTGLLRLACGLDAGGDGVVAAVHADLDPDLLCLHVVGRGDLDLALHGARQHVRAAQALLGTAVVVRASRPAPPPTPSAEDTQPLRVTPA